MFIRVARLTPFLGAGSLAALRDARHITRHDGMRNHSSSTRRGDMVRSCLDFAGGGTYTSVEGP